MRMWFLFLLCIFLLGCAEKQSQLTFAVGGAPNEVDYWENIIGEFEAMSDIEVKVVRQPTDTDQRRQTLIIPLRAKQRDPDVFLMDVAWIGQFAASGWLFSLNQYIEKSKFDTSTVFSNILQQVDMYDGEVKAFPVYIDCGILYYRKDLLDTYDCDIPETWEDLVSCAKQVQQAERQDNPRFYGLVWQGAQYEGLICSFIEFVAAHGGYIVDDTGALAVDNEKNIQALEFMRDLIHKHKISPPNTYTEMKEEEVRTYFQNGNALFERNWPYAWKLHDGDDSPVKGNVGMTLLPKSTGGRHAATLGGWHIGISAYSDRKDEAWRLVRFILSYDVQKRFTLELGWNPGRMDIYEDVMVSEKMSHIGVLKRAFDHAIARPNVPYYTRLSEVMQRYVNAAISGDMEPAHALHRAQEEIEKLVDVYHE